MSEEGGKGNDEAPPSKKQKLQERLNSLSQRVSSNMSSIDLQMVAGETERRERLGGEEKHEGGKKQERPRRSVRDRRPADIAYPNEVYRNSEGKGLTLELQRCDRVLSAVIDKRALSWPFLEPVNPVVLGIPDYFQIVKRPMDLGTVKRKLTQGMYKNKEEFALDVRLAFSNCRAYNPVGHALHAMAKQLDDLFTKKYETMVLDFMHRRRAVEEKRKRKRDEKERRKKPAAQRKRPSDVDRKGKTVGGGSKKPQKSRERGLNPLTYDEKRALTFKINQLPDEQLLVVADMVTSGSSNMGASRSVDDEIEIDIEKLDTVTLRKLESFVDDCLRGGVTAVGMSGDPVQGVGVGDADDGEEDMDDYLDGVDDDEDAFRLPGAGPRRVAKSAHRPSKRQVHSKSASITVPELQPTASILEEKVVASNMSPLPELDKEVSLLREEGDVRVSELSVQSGWEKLLQSNNGELDPDSKKLNDNELWSTFRSRHSEIRKTVSESKPSLEAPQSSTSSEVQTVEQPQESRAAEFAQLREMEEEGKREVQERLELERAMMEFT